MENRSQQPLREAEHPLDINGVIYAIVHIPTSRIYVGQTINSAHHRLKQHWQQRHSDNFRNKSLHAQMQQSHSADDFITWPLEFIDRSTYTINDTIYYSKFRDFASLRERYWIRTLWSLQPQGFNIALPAPKPLCRRFPNSQPENNFIRIQNDSLIIDHTTPGPTQHIRQAFNNLLDIYSTHPQTLEDKIKHLSKKFRLQLLHWSYSQIPNLYIDDKITAVRLTFVHSIILNSHGRRKKKTFQRLLK